MKKIDRRKTRQPKLRLVSEAHIELRGLRARIEASIAEAETALGL